MPKRSPSKPMDILSVQAHDEQIGHRLIQAANHMRENNLVEALAHTMSAIMELQQICRSQEDRLQLLVNR